MGAVAHFVEQRIPELIEALDQSAIQFGLFHAETIIVANRLALAFWEAGDIDHAVAILEKALDGMASTCPPDDSLRSDLLGTLGDIAAERGNWGQAAFIYREIVLFHTRRSGENHESVLAAQGDLALALFESGKIAEASEIEQNALDRARTYLGETHSVACVLAWNRALRLEDEGDTASARTILIKDLLWLLFADENQLQPDQKVMRAMLSKRCGWDTALAC